MRRGGLLLLLVAALAGRAAAVAAHPTSVAQARMTIESRAVEMVLSANLVELDLVLSLDRDLEGRVDAAELDARRAAVVEYLRRAIGVSAAGRVLPMETLGLTLGRSSDGRSVLEARLAFRSADPLADVAIRCEPLTELGADHTTVARIEGPGGLRQFVFRARATYREAT